ncbi:MAG: HEAT repeat domain-containing protein [Planctomycetota bacterium]
MTRAKPTRCASLVLVSSFFVSGVLGDNSKTEARKIPLAFDQLEAKIEPFGMSSFAQVENLRFEKKKHRVWYRAEGRPAVGSSPKRGGGVFQHALTNERTSRLNQLLRKTQWLTAPGGEGRATHTHPTKVTLKLTRDGKVTTIVLNGRRPEPFRSLLRELHSVKYQERRIYLHDYVSGKAGLDAWAEISREMQAHRGAAYAKSPYTIEYERYLPLARRYVSNFYSRSDKELIPALQIVAHLNDTRHLQNIHRMAHDRSSKLRREVATTLGRLGQKESLPVLQCMMDAPDNRATARTLIAWGAEAVPTIVEVIERAAKAEPSRLDQSSSEDMVRAYISVWDDLKASPDSRVLAAVEKARAALAAASGQRLVYYDELLSLVRTPKASKKENVKALR